MIVVRAAETNADLEAWIQVRRAVLPNESAGTLTELREREDPERLLLIAELDDGLAGSGLSVRSDISDRFFLAPRVLPGRRRRGVGTALLRELVTHAESYVDEVSLVVEDEGSRAFAERFGFREVGRQVEQVKVLGEERPTATLPPGVEVVSVDERPELLREAYELASEGYADLATDRPASISLRQWLHEEATLPAGSFVALAGEEIAGFSGLLEHDNSGTAEDGLTVVRREWRRRGLALALKQLELAWAAGAGYTEVVTWTQTGNEGMRRLNELLGYEYRGLAVTMCAPLPLPLDSDRS
ncbi:MAG TPA: GNAT family N-acetyltransferase [Gaiellaceae bacterium]|jgi:GNAT superfamily N-acetyltransferase